ncbi:MAG: metallophosphoesterase [Flavobacteriaceae bacterium]
MMKLHSVNRVYTLLFILGILVVCPGFGKDAEFPSQNRIVVVGDVHGDFNRMVEAFQLGKVVDKKGRWIGKKTHLVQLGDIPDRGPDSRKIVDYLMKLEKSAKRKGGRVHILIGNHDAMNVYGDLRYVTEEEYTAFSDKQSVKRLELLYEDEIKWIQENIPEENWPVFDDAYRKKWFDSRPPGFLEHRWSWLPDGRIGKWILSHNAVIKIGEYLFVHAGIGPAYADCSVSELNELVEQALQNLDNVESSILRSQEGPLWYRGLALEPEESQRDLLDSLLEIHDVDHIIVGHTVTGGIILPRFDGKVILADVGLSSYYGDNMACLVIENGNMKAIHRNGEVELPESIETDEILDYLVEVQSLEPGNQSIKNRISKTKNESQVEESISVKNPY